MCFLRTPSKHPSLLSFCSANSENDHIALIKREIFWHNSTRWKSRWYCVVFFVIMIFGIKRQLRLTSVIYSHRSGLNNRLLLCFLRTRSKHPSLLSFFSAKSENDHITLMKQETFGTNELGGKWYFVVFFVIFILD